MIILTLLQTLGASNMAADRLMATPRHAPTFAEEFDSRRIDDTKWRFDTARNRQGWPNHELQYYGPRNARLRRGALVIEARRGKPGHASDWGGQRFTSAKLVTNATFGYGFYEIRAKLPCGRGLWPAIWLLPSSGKWPDEGEIDVMEMVGWDPNVIHATLHTARFNHLKGTQRGAEIRLGTACSAFHRYQLDWQPHAITVGIDGRAFMQVIDDQPGGMAAWPFTRPFQLILNLAVGGDWGGQKGVDERALPQRMSVDYVRYWKPD